MLFHGNCYVSSQIIHRCSYSKCKFDSCISITTSILFILLSTMVHTLLYFLLIIGTRKVASPTGKRRSHSSSNRYHYYHRCHTLFVVSPSKLPVSKFETKYF